MDGYLDEGVVVSVTGPTAEAPHQVAPLAVLVPQRAHARWIPRARSLQTLGLHLFPDKKLPAAVIGIAVIPGCFQTRSNIFGKRLPGMKVTAC